MQKKFEQFLIPVSTKITNNVVLRSLRDGFSIITPLIMVLSIFVLIGNFPIVGWQTFWTNLLGVKCVELMASSFQTIFSFIGFLTCLAVAYSYGQNRGLKTISTSLIALISFLLLVPMNVGLNNAVSTIYFGPNGIFVGIIVALVSVELYNFAIKRNWRFKMHDTVPPAVGNSLSEMLPFAFVILIFLIVRIFVGLTGLQTVHNLVYMLLQAPFKFIGNSLPSVLLYNFIASLLWVFGINGPTVTNSIWSPIMYTFSQDNLKAFQGCLKLPHIYTQQFIDIFTTYGGGGSTLSLLIVMLLVCKSKRVKDLGKLAIIPGVFGINEPIVFGLPIILNPIMAIPFILVPVLNTAISGIVFSLNWIPYTNGVMLPWTTPPLLSGWLSTGSLLASVLQLVEIILGMLIYYPFIKMLDKQYIQEEQVAAELENVDIDFSNI